MLEIENRSAEHHAELVLPPLPSQEESFPSQEVQPLSKPDPNSRQ